MNENKRFEIKEEELEKITGGVSEVTEQMENEYAEFMSSNGATILSLVNLISDTSEYVDVKNALLAALEATSLVNARAEMSIISTERLSSAFMETAQKYPIQFFFAANVVSKLQTFFAD